MPRQAAKTNSRLPFQLWEKVELTIERNDKKGNYVTRIEDITDDSLIASKPSYVSGHQTLMSECNVRIIFLRPDAMYSMPASLSELPGGRDGLVKLHQFGRIERVQRRNYVRVNVKLKLKYSPLKTAEGGGLIDELNWHDSVTKDLSAGGMLMEVGDGIKKGDVLLVRIGRYEDMGIPRMLSVECCRVARHEDITLAGVKFLKLEDMSNCFSSAELQKVPQMIRKFDDRAQNRLMKFIFEEQVRERQKGLL